MVVFAVIAYFTVRTRYRGRGALDILTWMPLTVPGMRSHRAARRGTGHDRPGQQEHGATHPGRRPSHTGEHDARPTDRAQR